MSEDVLYQLMNWPEIETIVYSEHDNPHQLLGAHKVEAGILVTAFLPNAKEVILKLKGTNREYPMILEEENGFYAVLLHMKKIQAYTLKITWNNGTIEEIKDPYSYEPLIKAEDTMRFRQGIHYNIYELLGAHIQTIKGVTGTYFAVWAPNAVRVSVVGDFNAWDGRRHPMRRLPDCGIFELFLPGVLQGSIYKYEIKAKGGLTFLKSDPYANYTEIRPANASIVFDLDQYQWNDIDWMKERKQKKTRELPMSIYEVHLGSFKKPQEKNGSFFNYRDLAGMLCEYVKEMGYTHIEIMPIMEHPLDESWGYQVTGYYAATSRYGTPEDFMYFVDYMHQQGIGVILDWVPAHFPRDNHGLSNFDGTCLYEHKDPKQGFHPHWGTLIYNYGRAEVSNFLIANALFWIEKYHIDGIRIDAVASMLYLDYGKLDGEWIANKYGGNENLEAVEVIKHLNSIVKKRKDGVIMIAEDSTTWPLVTGSLKEGGLGFDYKWNMGWMNDFTYYMKQDPLFRKGCHEALTFSMEYAYRENFILVLSHDEVVHEKKSMILKMPGEMQDKFANLRVAYGFMTAHPGKKLLFMGQEFAQFSEWNEEKSLDFSLLNETLNSQMKEYVKDLNHLYRNHKALYQMDYSEKGFEWVSRFDADHSIISFMRIGKRKEEQLFVICNFTPVVYESYKVAVPRPGKYKEIFNSDAIKYGGFGHVNPRVKTTKKMPTSEGKYSITMTIPPLGIAIFMLHSENSNVRSIDN